MVTAAPNPWQALADPTRRHIFGLLTDNPATATELARDLPVSRPVVSQHLRVLLDTGLVEVHQQGRQRFYYPRQESLSALRNELETYWNQTFTTFKRIAEQSYQADTTTTAKGENHES